MKVCLMIFVFLLIEVGVAALSVRGWGSGEATYKEALYCIQ